MDAWSKMSESLLEKNNIKIPIEKRFFLNFIEDDDKNVQKKKILDEILAKGFLEDDPRLLQLQGLEFPEFRHQLSEVRRFAKVQRLHSELFGLPYLR